jgi:hypothetical protein
MYKKRKKGRTNNKMKRYGIYEVTDEYNEDGSWLGYRCAASGSTGKQGKLFKLTDGREHYQAKPKDEELEI